MLPRTYLFLEGGVHDLTIARPIRSRATCQVIVFHCALAKLLHCRHAALVPLLATYDVATRAGAQSLADLGSQSLPVAIVELGGKVGESFGVTD